MGNMNAIQRVYLKDIFEREPNLELHHCNKKEGIFEGIMKREPNPE